MRFAILALCVALLGSASALATSYLVLPDGTGDFPMIQSAIAAAAPGDSILLGDGVFAGDGNRDLDYLGKAITIQSLSGDPESCVIDGGGSWEDPHRLFIFQSGEGPTSILRGVTIANGRTLTVCPGCSGGGMQCLEQSSPRIENCIFRGNMAATSGGGLLCMDSAPMLYRCVFRDNATNLGGSGAGMSCFSSQPTLIQCTFASNSSTMGGGLACAEYSSLKLWKCLFQENIGTSDGGGAILQESSGLFSNCTFWGNVAGFGGALSCVVCDTVRVMSCTFSGNDAAYHGGGLHSWDSFTRLENSIFAFNTDGRGVYCDGTGSIEATCCDIFGNTDGDWAGCVAGQYGVNGNIAADPLFCDPLAGNFQLQESSPCAPDANPECGLIGEWPVGCEDPQRVGDAPPASAPVLACTPNPFVEGTTIRFRPPGGAASSPVTIHDIAGRRVRTLRGEAGAARWDGADDAGNPVPGGIYLVRVPAERGAVTERVIKLR